MHTTKQRSQNLQSHGEAMQLCLPCHLALPLVERAYHTNLPGFSKAIKWTPSCSSHTICLWQSQTTGSCHKFLLTSTQAWVLIGFPMLLTPATSSCWRPSAPGKKTLYAKDIFFTATPPLGRRKPTRHSWREASLPKQPPKPACLTQTLACPVSTGCGLQKILIEARWLPTAGTSPHAGTL